jgi:hypothetical protein
MVMRSLPTIATANTCSNQRCQHEHFTVELWCGSAWPQLSHLGPGADCPACPVAIGSRQLDPPDVAKRSRPTHTVQRCADVSP